MKEIILVKYGEIALKGLNKSTFEDMLQKNIKRRLKSLAPSNSTADSPPSTSRRRRARISTR